MGQQRTRHALLVSVMHRHTCFNLRTETQVAPPSYNLEHAATEQNENPTACYSCSCCYCTNGPSPLQTAHDSRHRVNISVRPPHIPTHILIHHWDGAVSQQLCEGVACVDILAAVSQVLKRQQHLRTRLQGRTAAGCVCAGSKEGVGMQPAQQESTDMASRFLCTGVRAAAEMELTTHIITNS